MTKIPSATGPIPSATGRCLCGAVSFIATEVDPHFHVCHCGMCRRHAGGPTMSVHVGGITFQGEGDILRYKSSDFAERGTCKKCGSHLFYRVVEPNLYIMSTGAFDDQTPFAIGGEIYIDNKPAGYAFAGDHTRETEHEFLKRIGAIS
jgi:hypothetical protein